MLCGLSTPPTPTLLQLTAQDGGPDVRTHRQKALALPHAPGATEAIEAACKGTRMACVRGTKGKQPAHVVLDRKTCLLVCMLGDSGKPKTGLWVVYMCVGGWGVSKCVCDGGYI